jgi:ribosomal protein S18 acetylase RimI-like enzyme
MRDRKQAICGLEDNLDKLHTTALGAERIRRNIGLQDADVVSWCMEAVRKSDLIMEMGKNWYVYSGGMSITINAGSFTVITAHPINPKVRVMRESDYVRLPEFCYQAIFIPEGVEPPPRSIINEPDLFAYIKDFGTKPGDFGVVAEQAGRVIGAAWTRIIPAYGHINDETPELAVSVLPPFRSCGAGTRMMKKLFGILQDNGYAGTSLSVQKDNPSVRLYKMPGYRITEEKPDHAQSEDFIMVKDLGVKPKVRRKECMK